MTKKTNALNISLLILFLTLEISFTQSLKLNLILLACGVGVLAWRRSWGGILLLLLLPLLPALSSYWSVMINGTGSEQAILLASRTYVFAVLGIIFALLVDLEELLLLLEQRGLPPNFVYGLLVVIHALPQIKQELADLKEASLLRGKTLHFWSPVYYLKAIQVAFSWRDQYVEAMYSHGYSEGETRTPQQRIISSPSGAGGMLAFLLLLNLFGR